VNYNELGEYSMQEFNIQNGEGEFIIHLNGDNSKYTVTYDHGQIIFENIGRKYIIPENLGHYATFFNPDPNTGKRKYLLNNVRDLYRDTTPTDFGINDIANVAPNSSHFTDEIIIGGINESIPVIAPNGVIIYVNGNAVASGTEVDIGDVVKFEIIANSNFETTDNYNISIGDITKAIKIYTEIGVKASCKEWYDAGYQTDGIYSINHGKSTAFDVVCDMTNGGWIDVYRTYRDVSNSLTYRRLFFIDDNLVDLPQADSNGFYQAYFYSSTVANSSCHGIHIHLNPKKDYDYKEIQMNWILQGSDEDYRCSSGNWVPLNGPGYNGGSIGYQASCPPGINCIQGTCQDGRDAPVSASYTNSTIGTSTYFTWSGSACGGFTTTANCSRSPEIPTNKVAVWFTNLKLR
jgi:hypothetical protein